MYFNLCFVCYVDHRDLKLLTHSFPRRRSSDLTRPTFFISSSGMWKTRLKASTSSRVTRPSALESLAPSTMTPMVKAICLVPSARSEEHTSELQSLMRISYAVFRLQKKKKTRNTHQATDRRKTNNTHQKI